MKKFLLLVLLLNYLSFAEEIAKVVYEVTKNSKYPITSKIQIDLEIKCV